MHAVNEDPQRARPGLPVLMWLFLALLVIWEPLTLSLMASAALARLTQFGPPALVLLGYRALVAALGVAIGRALWARDPAAPQAARAWLVLHGLAVVLTFATPYFPSNRPPSTKWLTLTLLVALDVAWWAWLAWSPAVHRAYRQET